MAYKMTELTDHVRVGRMSSGDLDLEIWGLARGWEPGSPLGPMEEFVIPSDAVEELFEFLR